MKSSIPAQRRRNLNHKNTDRCLFVADEIITPRARSNGPVSSGIHPYIRLPCREVAGSRLLYTHRPSPYYHIRLPTLSKHFLLSLRFGRSINHCDKINKCRYISPVDKISGVSVLIIRYFFRKHAKFMLKKVASIRWYVHHNTFNPAPQPGFNSQIFVEHNM